MTKKDFGNNMFSAQLMKGKSSLKRLTSNVVCQQTINNLAAWNTVGVSTNLWNRGASLLLRCQGGRRSQVEATNALIIQFIPCCQSMLAGKSRGFSQFYLQLDFSDQFFSPIASIHPRCC